MSCSFLQALSYPPNDESITAPPSPHAAPLRASWGTQTVIFPAQAAPRTSRASKATW